MTRHVLGHIVYRICLHMIMIFVLASVICNHVTHFEQHPLALVMCNSLIQVFAGAGQFATKLLIAVVSYDCDVSATSHFHARIVVHLRLATQPSSTTSDMKISKENAV